MMNRVKNVLPAKALKFIYYALFHLHPLYCPTIISITSNNNINKMIKFVPMPPLTHPLQLPLPKPVDHTLGN
jgi:hypothetical protein